MGIPFFRPYFSSACRKAIASDMDEVLRSGHLMMGSFMERFEKLFSETIQVPHAVSVNSCTTALTICLKYFGATGREVLVPSGSFITSVGSILFAGGVPILVDMDPRTLSFDLQDLERKIRPNTRGIVWVHLTGFVSPHYEAILGLARERGLFIIEDAAHALGASVDGKWAGSLGDAGCFSFYPTKMITSGTGGMIATQDSGLKKYAERMRLFGKDAETDTVLELGNDWFLDEIRACVGYHQLKELVINMARRREIARRYAQGLKGERRLELLDLPEGNLPSYYQFPVFLEKGIDRQHLIDELKKKYDIQTKGIYRPCHQEEVFLMYDDGSLKETEETLNRSLCLPISLHMKDEDVDNVVRSLVRELNS